MDAPLCPICKREHWGSEHLFHVEHSAAPQVPKGQSLPPLTDSSVPAGRFDRVKYQRDYMKTYRAFKAGKALKWPRNA